MIKMFDFKNIFNFGFNIENPHYNVIKLAVICNASLILVLIFFSGVNYFINDNTSLGLIEILVALVLVGTLILYKKYNHIKSFLLSTTILLFITSVSFYFYNEKTVFSSVWLFFFPLVVFLLNGLKIGRIFTTIYISIIIIDSYLGIGVYTNFIGFLNISIGLIVFSILAYLFEYSRKEAFSKMIDSIQRLEEISHLDELTKLYNRHFLNKKILQNKKLTHKPLLFCITDVDNFKAYNDYYGHQMGDEALLKIATAKNNTIGDAQEHFVVRLGGEEFGGFIFNSSNPKKHIEEFFEELESLKIEHIKNIPFNICTVSIGAVYCENIDGLNFSKLYQLADEALYEAKNSGKNRVVYKNI